MSRFTEAVHVLALMGLITGHVWAAEDTSEPVVGNTGRICVASLPTNAADIDRDPARSKTRRDYTYQFSVKVDSGGWVKVPSDKGVLIQDIPTGQRHTVTIRDGDRVIESFPFTFESKGNTELCLRYTPWYQTWHLDPPLPKAWWCKCETPGE